MINYSTKIEVTIFHENKSDADGLDDVLMNVVKKWAFPIPVAIYQEKPEFVPEHYQTFIQKFFPNIGG